MKLELLNNEIYYSRLNEINRSRHSGLINNDLKVNYSLEILNKYGQLYNVKSPPKKSQILKNGNCYVNSIKKMTKCGYGYVEGVITDKISGSKISHAWNINEIGDHIDFTIKEPTKFEYNGIIIPELLLYQVGEKNGHVWYCTLPYLRCVD